MSDCSLYPDKNSLHKLLEQKSVIVFDFDGVLVDSVEVKTEAFAELYESYGTKIVQQVIDYHRHHGGLSRFEKIKYYNQFLLNEDLDEEGLARLERQFSALVVDKVIGSKEVPGSMALLERCVRSNKDCFINSATPLNELQLIVDRRGMTSYFAGVYGSPQSKADNLLQILGQASCESSDILFFGDAYNDYDAAMRVAVSFIGLVPKGKESPFPCSVRTITDFTDM